MHKFLDYLKGRGFQVLKLSSGHCRFLTFRSHENFIFTISFYSTLKCLILSAIGWLKPLTVLVKVSRRKVEDDLSLYSYDVSKISKW